MTVYIDDMKAKYRHMIMSHMFADSLEELHAAADWLGLKRQWFQNHGSLPHYDVCQTKRQIAIKWLGVEDLPIRQWDGSFNPKWRAVVTRLKNQYRKGSNKSC